MSRPRGILAVTFGITPQEALVVMQAFAGQEFPTLVELAAHVVEVSTAPPAGPEAARERLSLLPFADSGLRA